MRHTLSLSILSILLFSFQLPLNNPELYLLYTAEGKKTDFEKMLRESEKADVVFFGESHNDPIHHWMELELAEHLYKAKGSLLIMGCEMFESDNQVSLDEYLNGWLNDSKLEENTRIWTNYKTDYKPLVQFARDRQIRLIATNTPRRYASMVYSRGFAGLDSLSPEAKTFLPPLPIPYDSTLACYRNLAGANFSGHVNPNLPKAQALKDATMAWFIHKNLQKGQTFYHWNGSYHSLKQEGILWYLKQYHPGLKIMVISGVDQEQLTPLDSAHFGAGDYIIVTRSNFPKSH